jgi:hypothetical protein
MKIKNVIMKNYELKPVGIKDLEITNRRVDNNENHVTIVGTKQHINEYLQDKPILSERLRTLNNLPKYRIINTTKERIY